MREKTKIKVALTIGIGTALLLTFLPVLGTGTTKKVVPAGQLRIARATLQNEALDPIKGPTDNKGYLTLMYDALVGHKFNPLSTSRDTGIASKWENSADYKTYTFYLRKGVKFHNGDEVTAEDVAFTLERSAGPSSVGAGATSFKEFLDRCEMVDKYTLKVHLKKPYAMFPELASELTGCEAMVVPKKYIKEKGDDYFAAHPVGTGPYKFKAHVPGSYIELEAVDRHWCMGVPKYKTIRFSIIPEATARIGLIQRGEMDIIELPRERAEEVKKGGLPIVEDPAHGTCVLFICDTFNTKYPVSDIMVRQAINFAIDRQALWKTLFGGYGKLTWNVVSTSTAIGWQEKPPYPYDPEKAKKLLKEAGYGPGEPKGKLQITLVSYSYVGFPELPDVIQAVANYWQAIGIEPKIVTVPDYGTWRKKWLDRQSEGAVCGNVIGQRIWTGPITKFLYHTDGRLTMASMPELDKAIDDANAALDDKERVRLIRKVDELIYENYLGVPLFEAPGLLGVNPKTIPDYKGWDPGPLGFDWNLEWLITRPPYGLPGMP